MAAKLPIFKNDDKDFQLMQSSWSTSLNPLLSLPIANGLLLKNITLVPGTNMVNHLLGRKLVGYFVTRQRSAAAIYDEQDTNTMPTKTLLLNSNATVNVDIWVF